MRDELRSGSVLPRRALPEPHQHVPAWDDVLRWDVHQHNVGHEQLRSVRQPMRRWAELHVRDVPRGDVPAGPDQLRRGVHRHEHRRAQLRDVRKRVSRGAPVFRRDVSVRS